MSAALQAPPLDHNLPVIDLAAALEPSALKAWLDQKFAENVTRADEIAGAGARFDTLTKAGIPDDTIAERAVDFSKQVKGAIAAIDDKRTKIKAPVLAATRVIDSTAKAISDRLASVSALIDTRITGYLRMKEAAARQRAEAEAARLAEEADRLAREAQQNAAPVEAAIAAIEQAEEAEKRAEAPALELTRTRSALGSVGGLRDNWTFEIEDITKVPSTYLTLNEVLVKAAIKTSPDKKSLKIPGLRIFNDTKFR